MKLTIFTVQLTDNDYLKDPVCRICIDSWPRLKQKIESLGYEVEIKLYGPYDEEVIEFKKIYNAFSYDDSNNLNRISDIFRIWILSKYKYHLWLDSDMYIFKDVKFSDRATIMNPFCIMYNKDDTETFSKIFDWYMENTNFLFYDMDAFSRFEYMVPQEHKNEWVVRGKQHLYKLMRGNNEKILLIKTKNKLDKVIDNFINLSEGYIYDNKVYSNFSFATNREIFKLLQKNIYDKYNINIDTEHNFIQIQDDMEMIELIKSNKNTLNIDEVYDNE